MIDEVRPELGALDDVVYLRHRRLGGAHIGGGGSLGLGWRSGRPRFSFDDPINIQYTSGTTGFPKGATLSHHNILNNGFFVGERCGYREADRVCIPVPFYHCFGMVMGNWRMTHGSCMVIPAPGFDPGATLPRSKSDARRSTACPRCGSPSSAGRLRRLRPLEPAHRDHGRIALSRGDHEAGRVRMGCADVTICYGMTETSPVSTQTRGRRRHRTPGLHRRHRAPPRRGEGRRPGDRPGRRAGQPGEFCTRGYSVMLGYWDDEERTEESIDAAGWMHTGDLATMDDAGYLNIVGRIKDMVIRGGENSPARSRSTCIPTRPSATCRWWGSPRPALRRGAVRVGVSRAEGSVADEGREVAGVLFGRRSPTSRCRATCSSSRSSR